MGYALPPRPCGGGHIQRCTVTNPSVRLPWTTRSSSPCLARAPEGPRRSLSKLCPLQGLAAVPLACRRVTTTLEHTRASQGFLPFSALRWLRPLRTALAARTRACLTRYVPSPGPLTLLTACSATTPVGLFHPTRALGVPPFRAFSRRAGTPLDARCPPDVSRIDPPRRPLCWPIAPDHGPIQRFQPALRRKPTHVAFRALLPPEVRDIAPAV